MKQINYKVCSRNYTDIKGVSNFSPIFPHMQLQIQTYLCSDRNNLNSILVTVTLSLINDICSHPKLRVDVSYQYSKFGVNRSKQTEVIEQKLNFYLK